MNEKLLQYIWKYQLFNKQILFSTDNQLINIDYPGLHNLNQGPDFINARIKIDNTKWFGSIELHVHSSDWKIHQHSKDKNYNNVILHVVWCHDIELHLPFSTLELKELVPKLLLNKYERLSNKNSFIPCEDNLFIFECLLLSKMKERMVIERLQYKAKLFDTLFTSCNRDWNQLYWQLLCKNFGGMVNADAFEKIAQKTPYKILLKHRNNIFQIEAIFFGQAGLLDDECKDAYPIQLKKEYEFLKDKYKLIQPSLSISYLRMRPSGFPTIRLAQLAMLIHHECNNFSWLINAHSVTSVRNVFMLSAGNYWDTHYCFDKESPLKIKKTGDHFIDHIIVNTIIFLMYYFGYYQNKPNYQTKSISWLEEIEPENNKIVNGFKKLNLTSKNAFDTQAYVHLKKEYCNEMKCLDCAIGSKILRSSETIAISNDTR